MDDAGYERALAAHGDLVFGYSLRMLRDPEDARDVAQEAWMRLWQHRHRVEERSARAFVMTCAHRLCLDRLRARQARPRVSEEALAALPENPAAGPERRAAGRETARALEAALAELSPRDRALVLLRDVHGLPYREIGDALGIDREGTLKAALFRARERLRARLVGAGVTP